MPSLAPRPSEAILASLRAPAQAEDPRPPETVADLFANPPPWLTSQLKVYRRDPIRHFEPLCAAVAAVVLDDDARASEVQEEVERILEEDAQS